MAQTVRESVGVLVPPSWQPEPCPDLTSEPFASVDAPWRTRIDQRAIDPVRTAALSDARYNVDVAHNLPGSSYQGVVFGMPYQVLDQRTKQTISFEELGLPPKVVGYHQFLFWRIPITEPVKTKVDVPPTIRREGDAVGAYDLHAYVLDPATNTLTEFFQLNHRPGAVGWEGWTVGYRGLGASAIARWNMSEPYNAPGQPRGVVAAHFPQMPHIVRYDELKAGRINHALFFALSNYAPAAVGYARHFDGSFAGHPVRAGERLRLKREVVERFPIGTADRVVAEAMWEYGITCGDRTDWSGSATSGPARVMYAQDPRITKLNWVPGGMWLKLSDFEVIRA